MRIGEIFREIRKSKKLSQKEIAKRLGVSQQYISKLENDMRPVNEDTLIELAEILNACPRGFVSCKQCARISCKGCNIECDKCIYTEISRT